MHKGSSFAPDTGAQSGGGGDRRGKKAESGKTNLQGISEACLLVLDAAHEQVTEGLLCDRMSFMNDFLGEGMRRSCGEPVAEPRPAHWVWLKTDTFLGQVQVCTL